ncbi:hypothetical protein P5V15_012646 [Pogonomyrmex californicus]
MCDNISNNPFAGLFSDNAVSFSSQQHMISVGSNDANYMKCSSDAIKNETENATTETTNFDEKVDELMAHVFGLTLRRDSGEHPSSRSLIYIDADSMEHAVFERLMLPNPKAETRNVDSHVVQTQTLIYLYECYCRLKHYQMNNDDLEETINNACQIVLRNANTALQEPDLFQNQDQDLINSQIHGQFIALFMDDTISQLELPSFINDVVEELIATNTECDTEDIIAKSFSPILDIIQKEAAQSNLFNFRKQWFELLNVFATIDPLAKLLILHSTPKKSHGFAYSDTLLGAFFNLSCLPKTPNDPYNLFDKPAHSDSVMEGIWIGMNSLSEGLHKVFHSLLKRSMELRHLTLQWLGNCLHTNANRGKLWNTHMEMGLLGVLYVSDGFMLNIGNVLLRLCQPFCAKLNDTKVPKIDPTYCSAEMKDEAESLQHGVHLKGLSSETCLIPTPQGENRPMSNSFGFITECFFLTHRALDLGYKIIMDKFIKTNEDLSIIQRYYNDALESSREFISSEEVEHLSQQLENQASKYFTFKASLLVPEMLEHMVNFHAMTAFWLTQVSLHVATEEEEKENFIPKRYTPITFPLPEIVPITLRCIPEFIVENAIDFLCFLRRCNPDTFEKHGSSFLNPILTEIIVLMESQHRLYNPHLRARLAESLEALLPITDDYVTQDNLRTPNLGTFHREQLFLTHPYRQQIIVSLLHVFVSIEMTGQSVQFEQKFNYRRPMYIVMEYLWKLDEHRNIFIALAQEAENNMEAVQPPLFLRFINLLMNDAVFLLDEALSNMTQLRQMIRTRDSGEWRYLPESEYEQRRTNLEHIGLIARFDNILGRKTIQTIKMLTTEIKSIFCHPTMVDRIASMLNYLLLQLVGPNKKNLKVNQKQYAFNPANLVLNICEIYINLSKNESFTLAVSQDGRSYKPDLFKLAGNVLVRIGGARILRDLDQFGKSVEDAANQKREEDEILTGIPDEFLDPIMSTVMTDPVILPSSKINIDRSTIARHLLSDQTDPFNRSPLTMDMIKSNVELQQKIQEWISQKKQEKMLSTDT